MHNKSRSHIVNHKNATMYRFPVFSKFDYSFLGHRVILSNKPTPATEDEQPGMFYWPDENKGEDSVKGYLVAESYLHAIVLMNELYEVMIIGLEVSSFRTYTH